MATEAKLRQLADRGCPVYYFYSSERYLVRQAVSAAVRILSADTDEEITVLDYGRVIARGDGKAIRNNPKVIAAYLGGD